MSELALQLIAENKKTKATTLDLGNCGLTEVPEEVLECVWLEELILINSYNDKKKGEENNITFLPPTLHRLQLLNILVIGGGWGKKWEINDLSPLTPLTNLKYLHCVGTHIADLSHLANLSNLEMLNCSFTLVTNLSPLAKLNNLRRVACAYTPITNLLPLAKLGNLQEVQCSFMQITDLVALAALTNLKQIYCSSTQVTDLSPIVALVNLQGLDCSSTHVSDLSPIAALTNLQKLDCSSTHVSDLSPIAALVNLEDINCSSTQVADLTPLATLTHLKQLDCSSTQVTNLSPILPLIKQGLRIYYGPVTQIAEGYINVDHCPLIHPPPEIVQQGNAAILSYFAEREKQQFKNNEIKLILVGNSTAGKTSLSQFLRERSYQPNQSSTHGIYRDQWLPAGHNLQVNIWDFGGQEYYHATHRLFLSRNAVYVLVWDAQTDQGGYSETSVYFENDPEPSKLQLEHFPQKWWLKNIRHYTRESNPPVPILLVQNKCARDGVQRVSGEFEKPPFDLKPEWLDNHIDLESTAAHLADPKPETKRWVRKFEDLEERLLHRLEHQLTKFEFAVYHREIRDRVRQLAAEARNDMPYSEFEEMCRGVEADAKMDLVQIYLRDITGDILYYHKNQRLQKRVFLRPAWVCDCIYRVLSRQVQAQNGFFGLDWVQKALSCEESEALDFVELMREFELVFEETDENGQPSGQLVAPQYLPDTCTKPDKLEGVREFANLTHAFTLWFPDFLPKSHIARFVAHWGSQAEQRLFWKNGLLFKTEGCTALVERTDAYKIRVEIQANHPQQTTSIHHIFQSFVHLEDGQASFAVSLNTDDFVWWRDVQEAMHSQARHVKTFPSGDIAKYVELLPFYNLQSSNNILDQSEMKERIRKLLQEAKTKEALELLASLLPEAGGLLTTFNEATRRNRLGLLRYELFAEKQNEVTYAALSFLEELPNDATSSHGQVPPPNFTTSPIASASTGQSKVKKVFISYSHKDETAMQELDKFLGPLERDGKISIWTDRKILPGQNWKEAILGNLEDTDLTLLLVSANFLDSDFINKEEIPRAFQRMNDHGKPVIPIILNFCMWDYTSLKDLQATPRDGRPIADFPNPAQAWHEVAKGVLALLNV